MSRRIGCGVSDVTQRVLWARAAGRCEYAGCNRDLLADLISGVEDRTFGFVAHIVAAKPSGPRGDRVRSPLLVNDIRNLMLLCHVHHKLIDVDGIEDHPEDRLVLMKNAHERRVDLLAAIPQDRASHVLRYAAKIGTQESAVTYARVAAAMLPDRYPADGHRTIDIELRGDDHEDHEGSYWTIQKENLGRQFARKVCERIEAREIQHLSVFAIAPQPLLMELGRLLCDIVPADVYQLHREPSGWRWPTDGARVKFRTRHSPGSGAAALILGLSATINDVRVTDALGPDVAIWAIEAEDQHNDAMQRPGDLAEFRRLVRKTFNLIKSTQGETATIHVFPALPVAAAVEVGRVWMPKADLPLLIYDQNRRSGGFSRTFLIGDEAPAPLQMSENVRSDRRRSTRRSSPTPSEH
jgi:SMODS-associated and fused to various effectors sensor domain